MGRSHRTQLEVTGPDVGPPRPRASCGGVECEAELRYHTFMGILDRLFRRPARTNIPHEHSEPVDPFYAEINVEDIGVYQRYFDRIIGHVDGTNHTKWAKSMKFDQGRLDTDDKWMFGVLEEAEGNGISGGLLQVMVHQYFFASVLEREQDRQHWVRRVMHPRPDHENVPRGENPRRVLALSMES